jgi:hypothetical protein
MSPELEWAMIAVSGYIREDGRPRVVIPLLMSEAGFLTSMTRKPVALWA